MFVVVANRLCLKRSILRLLWLASLISLLITGCQKSGQEPDLVETKPAGPISMMLPLHYKQAPSAEMLMAVEQAAQAKLDLEWVPNDIYRDKLINALETNSLKQVTFVDQADYVLVKNSILSGMFWDIGNYLEFYPHLKTLNKSVLKETAVDGKLYALYAERPASRQGVILRKDWLDRLHLQEPGTIEELYNALKQFTYNDPDGNGLQDTIGLADRADLTYGAFKTLGSYFGVPNNWALIDGAIVPDFETQEYIDTMNFMKKLLNERIINQDFALTSKSIQRQMVVSGKAGGFIGNLADASRLQDDLQKFEPKAELTLVNRIRGPKGLGVWSLPDYSGLFLFSKKAIPTEEDLKNILAFFDRSMGEQVSNLLKYGLPGKHYTVSGGKVVMNAEMRRLRDEEVRPLEELIIAGLSNPNIMKMSEESQDPLSLLAERLTMDNNQFLIRDPTQSLVSATYDAMGGELSQIIDNATYNYLLGRIDLAGFRSEISVWEKKGGAAIMREFTESYQKSAASH